MPSFEDFLAGARHQLKLAGPNRAVSALLVSVLEDMVRSMDEGTFISQKIPVSALTAHSIQTEPLSNATSSKIL